MDLLINTAYSVSGDWERLSVSGDSSFKGTLQLFYRTHLAVKIILFIGYEMLSPEQCKA